VPPALKLDYVHGPGRFGWGYYHLLTNDSYVALNQRLMSQASPIQCCCISPSSSHKIPGAEFYDEVKTIVYNRSVASIPDDILAYQEAIVGAQVTAQGAYHFDQNMQIINPSF